jgi:hypothetical protein
VHNTVLGANMCALQGQGHQGDLNPNSADPQHLLRFQQCCSEFWIQLLLWHKGYGGEAGYSMAGAELQGSKGWGHGRGSMDQGRISSGTFKIVAHMLPFPFYHAGGAEYGVAGAGWSRACYRVAWPGTAWYDRAGYGRGMVWEGQEYGMAGTRHGRIQKSEDEYSRGC